MAIYQRDFTVQAKANESPLTEADLAAHSSIKKTLKTLTPEIPFLSEESVKLPYSVRSEWDRYWLVDPLDGTKEFIKKNGEFTLNIALVVKGVPVFGIVHAPALDESRGVTWVGQVGEGAWKRRASSSFEPISVRQLPDSEAEPWKIVGSRSHGTQEFEKFCDFLPNHKLVSMGSSLKICLIAEGSADLYPRLAPTCEWDTAAAQAVLVGAGGSVLNANTLEPLMCNQQDSMLNPYFIACGKLDARWADLLTRSIHDNKLK
ncbi:3'(2'),5'-bisphosphate nucleotidase CysQ [Halomonas sp. DP8Y7-3]|nr:3'(2'),5'-bisphosphate nucleotidase CysQ [Halomonas sp. DP8Y7-3]